MRPYLSPLAVLALATAFPAYAQTAPQAKDTTTVTVTAKRADVVNKVDRKVYRTDADIQATTGSAADVLNNIPSVDVDPDGTLSLRGDTSVTVLIDGKPSSQMQGAGRGAALQGLSAANIAQIEVITSPSAEFKPDGSGGIINIVTKKGRKVGTSGVVTLNAGNGGRYNVNASGSTNIGGVTLSGGLGIRHDMRPRTTSVQSVSVDPSTQASTTTQQNIHQTESRTNYTGQAGLEYSPNDKQTLTLSADYMTRRETQSTVEHSTTSGGGQAYDRSGRGGGPRSNVDVAAGWEQKLGRDDETLSFNLQTGHSVETNQYTYITHYSAPAVSSKATRQNDREAYGVTEATIAYTRPFDSGSTLKLGYDGEYDQTAFDNSVANATPESAPLVVDHTSDNIFRYRQTIHAFYGTYDKKWDKFELQTGLRFEQVDIYNQQKISGDVGTQSYGTLYPTLNLLYTLSDNDVISAGFSKRVRRRDPEDLNPYINMSDPHNWRQGNPNLRPEMTDSYEIGYRHDAGNQSYALTGYYRSSRNGDTEILTVISNDVVLVREANLPSSRSGGVEFTASGKITPKLSYSLSGNGFYREINAQALGSGTQSNISLSTKAALDYQVSTKDRWQLSTNYNGKRLTAQGYVLPVTTVNIGYRHQVNDKFALVGTVSDLFDSQRQKRVFVTPTFTGTYVRHQGGQLAYIGLIYTFGAPKKSKDAGFTYDQ